jgi:hypothetical protein
MKRLFNLEYYSYNDLGHDLSDQIRLLIIPLLKRVEDKEYDLIDAEQIILGEISVAFCEKRMTLGSAMAKYLSARLL